MCFFSINVRIQPYTQKPLEGDYSVNLSNKMLKKSGAFEANYAEKLGNLFQNMGKISAKASKKSRQM